MREMWKLVCFSVWWELSFSRWVKSFGWSILICWSLVSGIPRIFFHMQCARILLDRRSLEISNKEETMQKTVLPLLFSRKRSKKFMNVADLSKEADSGDLAVKTSFTNNTLSFMPSAQKFGELSIFNEVFPFKPACVFCRGISCQTEADLLKRWVALDPIKSGIGFQ